MLTKHFLKTLIIFLGMIIIGLTLIFLVSYFDNGDELPTDMNNNIGVAK